MASTGGRFRELVKRYGKVALGIHFSVSAASITGLFIAIKNNVDVESIIEKVGMGSVSSSKDQSQPQPSEGPPPSNDGDFVAEDRTQLGFPTEQPKKRSRTAGLAASSGGALALAVLCNKALFPIRVPITIALTPPVARFLARRNIIKNTVQWHGERSSNWSNVNNACFLYHGSPYEACEKWLI